MVSQALLATTSFSLGILAFSGGIWLTIWCLNYSKPKEVRASMMAGYFVIVMSIASLAITSYNLVQAVMYPEVNTPYSYSRMDKQRSMNDDMRKMRHMKENNDRHSH